MCEVEPIAVTCKAGMGDCMSDIRKLLSTAESFEGFQKTYITAAELSLQKKPRLLQLQPSSVYVGKLSLSEAHTLTFDEMLPCFAPMATGHPEPGQKPRPLMGLP